MPPRQWGVAWARRRIASVAFAMDAPNASRKMWPPRLFASVARMMRRVWLASATRYALHVCTTPTDGEVYLNSARIEVLYTAMLVLNKAKQHDQPPETPGQDSESHSVESASNLARRTAVKAFLLAFVEHASAGVARHRFACGTAVRFAVEPIDQLDALEQVLLGEVGLVLDQQPHRHADQRESFDAFLTVFRIACRRPGCRNISIVKCGISR